MTPLRQAFASELMKIAMNPLVGSIAKNSLTGMGFEAAFNRDATPLSVVREGIGFGVGDEVTTAIARGLGFGRFGQFAAGMLGGNYIAKRLRERFADAPIQHAVDKLPDTKDFRPIRAELGAMPGMQEKISAAVKSILTPQSSNVAGYSYDPSTKSLSVTYKGGGTYAYQGVEPKAVKALGRNKSVGKTINKLRAGLEYEKTAAKKKKWKEDEEREQIFKAELGGIGAQLGLSGAMIPMVHKLKKETLDESARRTSAMAAEMGLPSRFPQITRGSPAFAGVTRVRGEIAGPSLHLPERAARDAILAHELGHYKNFIKFSPLYHGIQDVSRLLTGGVQGRYASGAVAGALAAKTETPSYLPAVLGGVVAAPTLFEEAAASARAARHMMTAHGNVRGLARSLGLLPALATYMAPVAIPAAITYARNKYREETGATKRNRLIEKTGGEMTKTAIGRRLMARIESALVRARKPLAERISEGARSKARMVEEGLGLLPQRDSRIRRAMSEMNDLATSSKPTEELFAPASAVQKRVQPDLDSFELMTEKLSPVPEFRQAAPKGLGKTKLQALAKARAGSSFQSPSDIDKILASGRHSKKDVVDLIPTDSLVPATAHTLPGVEPGRLAWRSSLGDLTDSGEGPRWFSGIPNVSAGYAQKTPASRLSAYRTLDIPPEKIGPWTPHISEDPRGRAMPPPRAGGRAVIGDSPIYERVIDADAVPPPVSVYKPMATPFRFQRVKGERLLGKQAAMTAFGEDHYDEAAGPGPEAFPADFDFETLDKGVKVELATTKDRAAALETALANLAKDPHCYDKAETKTAAVLRERVREGAPSIVNGMSRRRRQMQKSAGVAKKQVSFDGMTLKLEWLPGEMRTGKSRDGKTWSRKMYASYGYVPGTGGKGADGEAIDVYLAEDPVPGSKVYEVCQNKKDGGFDEHKYMLGYPTASDAKASYMRHMPEWAFGSMEGFSMAEFRAEHGQAKDEMAKAASDLEKQAFLAKVMRLLETPIAGTPKLLMKVRGEAELAAREIARREKVRDAVGGNIYKALKKLKVDKAYQKLEPMIGSTTSPAAERALYGDRQIHAIAHRPLHFLLSNAPVPYLSTAHNALVAGAQKLMKVPPARAYKMPEHAIAEAVAHHTEPAGAAISKAVEHTPPKRRTELMKKLRSAAGMAAVGTVPSAAIMANHQETS